MKKRFILLTAAVMLCSAAVPVYAADADAPAAETAFPTAQEIVDDIVIGWNLGNVLESHYDVYSDDPYVYEQGYGNPITTQKMIQDVHAAGFNAIRIPVTWMQKLDEHDNISEAWMNRVQEVVDWAYDDGMYVILNVHHDTHADNGWLKANYDSWNTYQGRFASIWAQISERFADYDYHLIFEGFNEISGNGTDPNGNRAQVWYFWEDWQNAEREECLDVTAKYNQLFVDTVRASGGNNAERTLLCNTFGASGDSSVIRDFKLPDDTAQDRLITGAHLYMPYYFAAMDQPDTKTYSSAELQKVFDVFDYYIDGPVVIGEFNATYKDNDEERNRWAKEYMTITREKGYKCFVWDTNATPMGLYQRQSGTWFFPEYAQTMLEAAGAESVSLTPYPDFSGNPNLAADPYVWTSWANRTGMAYVSGYTDSSATLRVVDSGELENDVMLNYGGGDAIVPFEEGKEYRVSFDIACEGIGEITDASVNIGYTAADYTRDIIDCKETLRITPDSAHYEFLYSPSETHDRTLYF
ncbi:MAG: cellulase family glycosylhydrolase [Oscillospiraceae bacterium]|nr:cellulase family glycosylhydrolase [Oscillospiraceae bacterium]